MKKLLLLFLCVPYLTLGQITSFNCSLLNVIDVVIDNVNLTIDIAIYDGNIGGTQYPHISFTLDNNGDTIQNGNINLFGTMGMDTTWYNYSLLNPISPVYPLSIYFLHTNFSGPNPGEDTCILSYDPSCDSVIVSFNQIDTTTTTDLIYFDVQVSGYGPSVGYPGFVLLNNIGDTIAYENFNTAGNVFTLIPNANETRFLDVIQSFSLPFGGFLHLVDSWFAGNPSTACIYPFNISVTSTDINEINKNRNLVKIINVLGRELNGSRNQLLFYIFNDGTLEKRIIIE